MQTIANFFLVCGPQRHHRLSIQPLSHIPSSWMLPVIAHLGHECRDLESMWWNAYVHRLNLSLYSHRKHQSSVTCTVQVGQHQFHSCCRSSNITDRASSPWTVATDAGTSAGSAVFASVDTRAAAALADTGVLASADTGVLASADTGVYY